MNEIILKNNNKILNVRFIKTTNKSSYFKVENGFVLARIGKYHNLEFAKDYISNKFNKFYNMVLINLKNFENSNSFIIFGKKYEISYLNVKSLYLIDDINNIIYINTRYKNKALDNIKRRISIDLLNKKVYEFNNIYKDRLNNLNIKLVPIKYKKLKTKYGYCDYLNNYICISLFMIKLEKENIFHLLLHEYTHFLVQNHSKDFYNILRLLDSNYKENDKRLKENHIIY